MQLCADARENLRIVGDDIARMAEKRDVAKSNLYHVDERVELSPAEFQKTYVARRRPVVLRGALKHCPALSNWTIASLRERVGSEVVALKRWSPSGICVTKSRLDSYIDELDAYERARATDVEAVAPAYLHDIPLTSVISGAARDLAPFPNDYFPKWYRPRWTTIAQMFLGPTGSLTPLHFDCLLTHNLFFQICGHKRFILLPHEELEKCYPRDWRWCRVDAEKPDVARFPLFLQAQRAEVVVGPTDILYMPPGTLHHVRSLDRALSFNVDWHTRRSVANGILALLRGMPRENVYYNLLIALGLWAGVPIRHVLPYYKSYLTYIS
jgi:ribosomal protein L16 Arg81 hydroxylase